MLALRGAGRPAAAHIEAQLPRFRFKRVRGYTPSLEDTEAFCIRMAKSNVVAFAACQTPSECLSDADIVCATTSSSVPVFDGADLKPGAHLNAIGSYTPEMAEMDSETVARCRIFVDSREAAEKGAGELIQAHDSGVWNWKNLGGELSDLVLERAHGRQSEDEITLFKSVGLAVQDATAAEAIYRHWCRGGS